MLPNKEEEEEPNVRRNAEYLLKKDLGTKPDVKVVKDDIQEKINVNARRKTKRKFFDIFFPLK